MSSNTDTGDTVVTTTMTGNSSDDSSNILLDNQHREDLITTAVNFLHNDKVQRSSITQKQKFLRSKGLTEHEIQLAFERAGVFTNDPNTVINFGISHHNIPTSTKNLVIQQQQNQQQQEMSSTLSSMLMKFKDMLSSAAIISSLIYAVYTVFKRFIEPFLFGRKKKPSIEETLEKIDTKVENQIKNLNCELVRVREEIHASNKNDVINRELNNFKSDLDAIKGLLLNRNQFASGFTTVMPPSIPSWQLTSQQHRSSEQDKNDDADGSGSGSSETEVVVKNSDSSIEIM